MITTFQTCYKPVTKSGKCLVFMNRLLQFREISILPDLRNRFVVGAGSTYAVKATGGAETHSHTATIEATTLTVASDVAVTHVVPGTPAGAVSVL